MTDFTPFIINNIEYFVAVIYGISIIIIIPKFFSKYSKILYILKKTNPETYKRLFGFYYSKYLVPKFFLWYSYPWDLEKNESYEIKKLKRGLRKIILYFITLVLLIPIILLIKTIL